MNKNSAKLLGSLLFFDAYRCTVQGQSWQALGPDDNNNEASFSVASAGFISLAFNGTTPYVAFQDVGNNSKATVMKWDGSNWVNVGTAAFSSGGASYLSLAFYGNTPYVAYQGNTGKATVMKFDGTNWITVGTEGFSAGVASFISMAFNGDTPYIAYKDVSKLNKATVMKFDGNNWITVGTAGFSQGGVVFTSLAFQGTTPYVAYEDDGNGGKATVMKFDGSNWVAVGAVGLSAGTAIHTSLQFNNATPYLAYQDGGNSNKATVKKFDGTNWVTVGSPGFSAATAIYTSLAFNGSTPYVAYLDGGNSNKVTVMQFDGTGWLPVGTVGVSAGGVNYPLIGVNNNNIYLVYNTSGAFAKVYSVTNTLPVNFTSIKAYEKNEGVQVNWHLATESNILHYDIEKSVNGNDFFKTNEVAARSNNNNAQSYSSFDKNPVPGNNFYRIKAVENSGKANYSQVVNVKLSSIKGNIGVFPNPIEGNTLSLQFTNQPKGLYEVSVMNSLGQQFLHTVIQHAGGSGTETIRPPASIGKGVYHLQVKNGNNITALKIIAN